MKKLFLIFCLCLVFVRANAQEPRPSWVRQLPHPPSGANFIYVHGMGIGSTEEEAEVLAWKNAFHKALHEGALIAIKAQAQTLDKVFSMNDLETMIPVNVMARHLVCQTVPIYTSSGKIKVYVLLQVQRDGSIPVDFLNYNCTDPIFDADLKKWNFGDYGFTPSVFVPGMAQLHKGSTAKGIAFITAEALCIGGIIFTESQRASYDSKIGSTHNIQQKKDYIDKADTYENARNILIGGAIAVYLWNVIDGIAAKGKEHISFCNADLHFTPYATHESAGLALSFKF